MFESNGCSTSTSMFQTGTGKTVNVSSTGLLRARALLGVDEDSDDCSIQGFEPAKKKFHGVDMSRCEKQSHLEESKMLINNIETENDTPSSKFPLQLKGDSSRMRIYDEDTGKHVQPGISSDSATKPPPIKFSTAGGRFISVSRDALQRAKNLLGDPEMDSLSMKGIQIDSSHQFEQNPKTFVSPMKSTSNKKLLEAKSETLITRTNLMRKFDAEESICKSNGKLSSSCLAKSLQEKRFVPDKLLQQSAANDAGVDSTTKKGTTTELKRLGKRSYVSPFKMPRCSKFITPLNCNFPSAPDGFSSRESAASYSRKRVCTRFPFQHSRLYVKEFLKEPPTYPEMLEHLPDQVRQMNPRISAKYTFCDGSQPVDVESFTICWFSLELLSDMHRKSKLILWVTNHCKWIVWKLASYERCYSSKTMMKFLTVTNVLEELKYRYEREVNHGQRSAIKKVLEGDASPSSMLVLCVSKIENSSTSMPEKGSVSIIELTDGWYSVSAQLDLLLSKQLAAGKLFVGQKLRICGAGLSGWNGPVSPLEVCFFIWLQNGGFIVRSEKMEASFNQLYNQRRSNIIEGITSDFQRGSACSDIENDYDNEGAKILKMLESAAEPELLMAEMSSKQLASFSNYRAKVEESRQCDLQRLIEKALEDAGLNSREVTPFMRLRVVGLRSREQCKGEVQREGLITIWNPTEQQVDGSACELQSEASTSPLLAISFCSPSTDDDSISPINYNLVGSIIGFCNLVKRAKDLVNHMWVAEATENSTYYLKFDHPYCSHLKDAFGRVKKWEQSASASSVFEKLREKVLHIVDGPKG
ncbi:Protein BREAST CANCER SUSCEPTIBILITY 2-like protein B [Bienertia sinuspersici]